ncbi:MAG: hypothetical protein IJ875_06055 [Solobacterium sp.]|nr:hypothetical protein [Solobacterium sp.]
MKLRIFISMHYMELGGAEISLIGLLQAIDYKKYDVDLFIHSHQGELMRFIPEEVNLLEEIPAYSMIEKPVKEVFKKGFFLIASARIIAKIKTKIYLMKKNHPNNSIAVFQYVGNAVTPVLPSLKKYGNYDLAISFLTPHNIVLDKVSAKKKIAWIHTDYSFVDVNPKIELPIWSEYNNIVSISPDVSKSFLKVFPSLKDKIVEIENILSPAFVRSRAEEFDAKEDLSRYVEVGEE